MENRGITLVKLGGSLITDKTTPETPRRAVIQRLVGELADVWEQHAGRLVLGHGSGSFGHVAADRHEVHGGYRGAEQRPGISRTQRQAARLHHMVLDALIDGGLPPFSVAPSSAMVASGQEPAAFFAEPITRALGMSLLPVVYGDVVTDRRQGITIGSTEHVLRTLAYELESAGRVVERVLWLGNTDGIYDAGGATIPRVTPANVRSVFEQIESPEGTDVTGGIRHRLKTAVQLAARGIPSVIVNGTTAGVLRDALQQREVSGTRVAVSEEAWDFDPG